jgi:hydrogenase maturation factor
MFNPGIDVLKAARTACGAASVHSMHDPTEGGLVNGVIEMALASGKEFEIDLEKVKVYDESRILCREYGLDPLGVIASGALLLTISPSDLSAFEKAFRKAVLPVQVIGNVNKGPARGVAKDGKGKRELSPLPRDEILKIYQ